MGERNPLVYCTIPLLIAMQEYHTNTEDTGSLSYNSICYITSRIGWVSLKRIYRYNRCRRDPGKLYNNFSYTYCLTKDQPPHTAVGIETSKYLPVFTSHPKIHPAVQKGTNGHDKLSILFLLGWVSEVY